MLHLQQTLHFQCTGCGKCCTGNDDYYIAMSKKEAEIIRQHLQVTENWFRRRYVSHLTRNTLTARMHDGHCVFLGKDKRCRIYNIRPIQCRTYPYWPEILENKETWNAEAKHCEGINLGSAIPIAEIKRKLKQQLHSEQEEL